MVNHRSQLDATFAALADPSRRQILDTLSAGEASIGQLAGPFDVSLQAISKHIHVLESAGLLVREKEGRVHWCRLTATPMKAAGEWIGGYRQFWEQQLDALEAYVSGPRRREGQ